ncbi:hypothetical protein KUCAC02_013578 [Chaenocephalus aceratus]|uniref:Uncharacterized protein n=1 Tax=Chaenocephalus aceratus TaxID=36190 RepID=A0ACB9WB83_CHAAC|nr:hypothetical protein KUCAC02_013578 [Chaenocephalus aceratus]
MRTLEEVQATLQIAKLQDEELQKTIHCLSFGENVSSADYCLLELDDTLCKLIEAGERTYDLKIADTSNMLLFVPDCRTPDQLTNSQENSHIVHTQIWGFSNSYWELRKQRPKLKKLKKEEDTENRYTMEICWRASRPVKRELKTSLEAVHACQIDGYWRMLDFDYEMKLLGHVTQLVDSESWAFNRVPLQTCLEELAPLEPKQMIKHCLNCYGKRYSENDDVLYALDEDRVCRGMALMLLQNAVKFNLREFQEVWQQSVPEGMSTRLDQLKVSLVVALVDRSSRPETINLLRVEDLSEDTLERFNQLFTLREKWTEDDITPYIKDLCGEKQSTGALLTKHARSSMQNGIKVFNSRRPVAT